MTSAPTCWATSGRPVCSQASRAGRCEMAEGPATISAASPASRVNRSASDRWQTTTIDRPIEPSAPTSPSTYRPTPPRSAGTDVASSSTRGVASGPVDTAATRVALLLVSKLTVVVRRRPSGNRLPPAYAARPAWRGTSPDEDPALHRGPLREGRPQPEGRVADRADRGPAGAGPVPRDRSAGCRAEGHGDAGATAGEPVAQQPPPGALNADPGARRPLPVPDHRHVGRPPVAEGS